MILKCTLADKGKAVYADVSSVRSTFVKAPAIWDMANGENCDTYTMIVEAISVEPIEISRVKEAYLMDNSGCTIDKIA